MNAGRGAWHQGWLRGSGPAIGFQLWVPMPPGIEDGAALGQYVPPAEVPSLTIPGGEVKVLLGSLPGDEGCVESPVESHQDMNYFVVNLAPDHTWFYQPPPDHTVAWAYAFEGTPLIQQSPTARELLILEGTGAIDIFAPENSTQILIGTARPHEYPLFLGTSSIHTNAVSLAKGSAEIARIGAQLRDR